MSTNAKHTPAPWATDIYAAQQLLRDGANDIDHATIYVNHGSGKGSLIATIPHDPQDGMDLIGEDADEFAANAAHIVRCVNAHDDLVAALERSLNWLSSYPGEGALSAYAQARAALARAKGDNHAQN